MREYDRDGAIAVIERRRANSGVSRSWARLAVPITGRHLVNDLVTPKHVTHLVDENGSPVIKIGVGVIRGNQVVTELCNGCHSNLLPS
jgi:hypothetical protein